jgi:hypothetical protein
VCAIASGTMRMAFRCDGDCKGQTRRSRCVKLMSATRTRWMPIGGSGYGRRGRRGPGRRAVRSRRRQPCLSAGDEQTLHPRRSWRSRKAHRPDVMDNGTPGRHCVHAFLTVYAAVPALVEAQLTSALCSQRANHTGQLMMPPADVSDPRSPRSRGPGGSECRPVVQLEQPLRLEVRD